MISGSLDVLMTLAYYFPDAEQRENYSRQFQAEMIKTGVYRRAVESLWFPLETALLNAAELSETDEDETMFCEMLEAATAAVAAILIGERPDAFPDLPNPMLAFCAEGHWWARLGALVDCVASDRAPNRELEALALREFFSPFSSATLIKSCGDSQACRNRV